MKLRSAVATVSVLAAGCLALCGQGFQTNDFTAVNLPIPDGNPAGAQDVHQISSVIRRLNEVRVRLKISAATNSFAFNGDLYVYLRHSAGASAHLGILLNRAGKTTATPLGYADDGFDVVFADTAAHDIHTYRLITMPSAGTPLTGAWQPDARFVDPLLVDTNSPRTVFLGNLAGMEAQGEWTLFVADMDPGGVHVLESWSLELSGAVAPMITWSNPAPIVYGTPLGAEQLNATTPVPGAFLYEPPAGTRLVAGRQQPLTAIFEPADTNTYVTVTNVVSIDVLPRALSVTAANTNRPYGAANPEFTAELAGLVEGETLTATWSTPATLHSPVGEYPIELAEIGPTNVVANYTLTSPAGTLSVAPASLTVAGILVSNKVYDGSVAAGLQLDGATLVGVLPGDDVQLETGPVERVVYDNTENDLLLRFDLAGLEAGDEIILDGASNPLTRFSFEFWGEGPGGGPFAGNVQVRVRFYRNDGPPSSSGYAAPGTVLFDSGPFPIEATPRATLTYQGDDFTRLALVPLSAPLPESFTWTVQFSGLGPADAAGVDLYSPPTVGRGYSDYWENDYWLLEDNQWVLKTNSIAPIDFAARCEALMPRTGTFADPHAGTNKAVALLPLGLKGADAGNYQLIQPTLGGNIMPAALTVTGVTASNKVYDARVTATLGWANANLAGLRAGDDVALFTTAASGEFANANAGADIPVQVSGLSLSGVNAGDYAAVVGGLSASILPAPAVVTAHDQSRAYGEANPELTGAIAGLQGTDALPVFGQTTATPSSPVGTYVIEPMVGAPQASLPPSAANYLFTFSNATLTVTTHPLTVTAADVARPYAATNPALTGQLLGVQNDDAITASFATGAQLDSVVGTYPITPALQDPAGRLTNYLVTLNDGTLTILPAATRGVLNATPNPARPGTPVTVAGTFQVLPPSTATIAGQVQFQVDGIHQGAPVPLTASAAEISLEGLAPGQHDVSATFTGDANLLGSDAALVPAQLINSPPTAVSDSLSCVPGQFAWNSTTNLLRNDGDPELDPVTFTTVAPQSDGGGTVTLLNGWFYYQPPAELTGTDAFAYTIADRWGAQATGVVNVVLQPDGERATALRLEPAEPDGYRLEFTGAPLKYYSVECAPGLPAASWQFLGFVSADANGFAVFADSPPPETPARFYRVGYPTSAAIGSTVVLVSASPNPCPPGQPVILAAELLVFDPGHGLPTGRVQFHVDGAPYGSAQELESGRAQLVTSDLAQGPHLVSVTYPGDGPFLAATGMLAGPLMIDTPPVAARDTLFRSPTGGTKVSTLELLSNDTDADGDSFTLASVSVRSVEGGTLELADGWVFYTPPGSYAGADAFTYTVRDTFGVSAVGKVDIIATIGREAAANVLIQDLGAGAYHLAFSGIPWRPYTIECTASLNSPAWQPLGSVTADAQGHFDFLDQLPTNAVSRYYHSVYEGQPPTASPFRQAVWTNFLARTNGRVMELWQERWHPTGWPQIPPRLVWNTNSLIHGLEGFTAISQCNEFEGSPGQVPVTLLTRRHGYLRGHHVGGDTGVVLTNHLAGKRVWFCSASNDVVTMTIAADIVRLDWIGTGYYDYTLVIFTADAPADITPVFAISAANFGLYYYNSPDLPFLTLGTEQTGRVATNPGLPPFLYDLMKGGDSGSPNLIPSPDNKLILYSGRTSSGPSAQMQSDLDALTTAMGLDPASYPLRWYDFSPWAP